MCATLESLSSLETETLQIYFPLLLEWWVLQVKKEFSASWLDWTVFDQSGCAAAAAASAALFLFEDANSSLSKPTAAMETSGEGAEKTHAAASGWWETKFWMFSKCVLPQRTKSTDAVRRQRPASMNTVKAPTVSRTRPNHQLCVLDWDTCSHTSGAQCENWQASSWYWCPVFMAAVATGANLSIYVHKCASRCPNNHFSSYSPVRGTHWSTSDAAATQIYYHKNQQMEMWWAKYSHHLHIFKSFTSQTWRCKEILLPVLFLMGARVNVTYGDLPLRL